MNKLNNKKINEATGSNNAGLFKVPLVLSPRDWDNIQLAPFTNTVNSYTNAELAYQENDGDFIQSSSERNELENKTRLQAKILKALQNFSFGNDDDGGGNITENSKHLNEDLGVWFGTKKKPKGSSQPKGPWVNICKKDKNGKHPPCGRDEATSKAYPKCRAAGVAGKMSDSEKKSACSQKRKAEKANPKTGKGNKPTFVHQKTKKESINNRLHNILIEEWKRK
jgi:hypothetical protein